MYNIYDDNKKVFDSSDSSATFDLIRDKCWQLIQEYQRTKDHDLIVQLDNYLEQLRLIGRF